MNHLKVEQKTFNNKSNLFNELTQQLNMRSEFYNYNNFVNFYSHCANLGSDFSTSQFKEATTKSSKKSFFISQLLPELFDESNIKKVIIILMFNLFISSLKLLIEKLKSNSKSVTEEESLLKISPNQLNSFQPYNSDDYLTSSNQLYLNEYLRRTSSIVPSLIQKDSMQAIRINLESSPLSKAFSLMKKKLTFSQKDDPTADQTFYENLVATQQSADNQHLDALKNSNITSSSSVINFVKLYKLSVFKIMLNMTIFFKK